MIIIISYFTRISIDGIAIEGHWFYLGKTFSLLYLDTSIIMFRFLDQGIEVNRFGSFVLYDSSDQLFIELLRTDISTTRTS